MWGINEEDDGLDLRSYTPGVFARQMKSLFCHYYTVLKVLMNYPFNTRFAVVVMENK